MDTNPGNIFLVSFALANVRLYGAYVDRDSKRVKGY